MPKTGGTTIHNDLHETFGVSYLRSTLNRGRGGHEFLTDEELRQQLAPMARGMSVVSGHLLRFPVPLDDTDVAYTTVVRDPFDWALSHYFHARRRAWIDGDTPFDVYLTNHFGLGNYQALHFSTSGRAVDAMAALDQFALVGVTDELHAYREMLATLVRTELGAPMRVVERVDNAAPNRTRTALDLSAREQRVVLDVLGEDVKLYHYARSRFRQQQRRVRRHGRQASITWAGHVTASDEAQEPSEFRRTSVARR